MKTSFEAIGGEWVDPPLLMPASVPLELSGEGVRTRLISTSDVAGQEMALRPDLTLPLASMHIDHGADLPKTYRYHGKAFRRPVEEGEPTEFYQTGFECFGYDDRLERDVLVLSSIASEIASSGLKDVKIRFGDISVFENVVKALGVSPFWQDKLLQAFRRESGIEGVLNTPVDQRRSALGMALAGLEPNDAEAVLDEVLAMSGGDVIGGRTRSDILERLQRRAAAQTEGSLDVSVATVLRQLVMISGTPSVALQEIAALGRDNELDLSSVVDQLDAFFNALQQADIPYFGDAEFSVSFGRRFDYYDGFVFDLTHSELGERRALGSGGRYDGLIARLSHNARQASAIGGVIRPDRIMAVRGGVV